MADSKYSDACYIADYIDEFAKKNAQRNAAGFKGFKAIGASKDSGGGAHEIIARLTSRNGKNIFTNLEPPAMSLLIPKVRLYKQIYDGKNLIGQPEFIFEDFYNRSNVDSIFAGNARTIGGKGLVEASWALKGTNPAEAEKVINVNLKFEFQSAVDLLGDRYDPSGGGTIVSGNPDQDMRANMIDLILHPPQLKDSLDTSSPHQRSANEYMPAFYKLKMVVGWARPQLQENKLPGLNAMETRDLLAELSNQRMSIILNLVSHEFDIQENGQISLGVEYIGSLEESINGNDADILRVDRAVAAADPITQQQLEQGERQIADLEEYVNCLKIKESDSGGQMSGQIEDAEEQITDLEEENKEARADIDEMAAEIKGEVYQQFLSNMQDYVMEMETDEDGIEEWVESLDSSVRPPFSDSGGDSSAAAPDNADDMEDAVEDTADSVSGGGEVEDGGVVDAAKEEAQDPAKGYIHYVALGDIMSLAIQTGMGAQNKQAADSIIITGPVVINHPRGGRYVFNLADLPIPYQDFQAWFFESVVRKQLASYPLKQFIKDIMEKLVKKVLQPAECFQKGRAKRQVSIAMNNFTISEQTAEAASMSPALIIQPNPIPRITDIASRSLPPLPLDNGEPEHDVNCLMFYMNNYKASDLRAKPFGENGSYDDSAKGIYHFYIGAEGGLVKSIDFTRTDVQGLREARQAESRNLGQIRDVYDASVTLFGNQMFYPGMKVFINPPLGFGRPESDGGPSGASSGDFGSLSNLLGIGGYYDVITVESTITQSGQYETTIECKFAQSGGINDSVSAKCDGIIASPPQGI
jgi:hypothetical protein